MKTTRIHLSVIQLLIAILVYLNHDEVEGLSKKDHEALERQLKLLNKPAVKTIKVDFYFLFWTVWEVLGLSVLFSIIFFS